MIRTSAPGRICLFGEHQDYLKLPVISAAIDLTITIQGEQRNDSIFSIDLPNINQNIRFTIPQDGKELEYVLKRDYFRSVFNHLLRNGAFFNSGWSCKVDGNIPINTGTASSSALCVAWTKFLLKVNSNKNLSAIDNKQIGKIAYLAEVEEFGEPGGMMDHYASSYKGILYQEFISPVELLRLPVQFGTFVLGDSLEPKHTLKMLKNVKDVVVEAIKIIKNEDHKFSVKSTTSKDIQQYGSILTKTQLKLLEGTIRNRDITLQAVDLLSNKLFNINLFKELIDEHQIILSEILKISTPKIDKMLNVANRAGAYGGKINGSGGGGCMFVYAPENSNTIAKAIEAVGGKAYTVNISY